MDRPDRGRDCLCLHEHGRAVRLRHEGDAGRQRAVKDITGAEPRLLNVKLLFDKAE